MKPATGVVVPIRAFADGKSRLAAYLAPADRARLLEAMAERVVGAAGDLPVVVVSSAPEVRSWAGALGLGVLDDPGSLDAAARVGLDHWAAEGAERVAVVHADLPLVDSLSVLAAPGGSPVAVLAPCHRDDGTPALSVPTGSAFEFAYGPGSFERHRTSAAAAGLEVRAILDVEGLRRDVDSVEDLDALVELAP